MFQRILGIVTVVCAAAVAILAVGGATSSWPPSARVTLVAVMAFVLGSGVSLLLMGGASSMEPESNEARTAGWTWVYAGDWLDIAPPLHEWMMVLPSGDVVGLGRSLTIGSSSACDIVLSDPWVLPYHARVIWDGSRVVVTDLSGGQTFVGSQRVRGRFALDRGAVLRLGTCEISLHRDVSGLADRPLDRITPHMA